MWVWDSLVSTITSSPLELMLIFLDLLWSCSFCSTLKADQRGTVSLSTRPSSTSPSAPQEGTNDPYLFYWTCTRKAGGAASTDMNRAGDPPVGMLKVKDGCGFFRVLDMVKEGRDCGVGFGEA